MVQADRRAVYWSIHVLIVGVRAEGVHVFVFEDPYFWRVFVRDAAHNYRVRRSLVDVIRGASAGLVYGQGERVGTVNYGAYSGAAVGFEWGIA